MVTKEINQEADFSLTDQEPAMLTVQAGKQSDVTFHYFKTEDALKVKIQEFEFRTPEFKLRDLGRSLNHLGLNVLFYKRDTK